MKVPPWFVAPPEDESLEHVVGSVEHQLADLQQVPVLACTMPGILDLAHQPRNHTSHLAQGVHVDSKVLAGKALAPGRKSLDFFRQRLEPGEFRKVNLPRYRNEFRSGKPRCQALQPFTPQIQLTRKRGQRAVGKYDWRGNQLQEIRRRQP